MLASGDTIADKDAEMNRAAEPIEAEAESRPESQPEIPPEDEGFIQSPKAKKPKKLVSQADWTLALKDVIYKDDRKTFRITRVFFGYPNDTQGRKPRKEKADDEKNWHVDYLNTRIKDPARARSVELLEDVLTTGRDTKQQWFVDRQTEFEAYMRKKGWLK